MYFFKTPIIVKFAVMNCHSYSEMVDMHVPLMYFRVVTVT
jgi:hypothetical protein